MELVGFERFDADFLRDIGMFTGVREYQQGERSDKEIQEDLERYREFALELGCSDAKIIPASMANVDERVRIRCRVPVCICYGTCVNCPPHTPSVEEMRTILSKYKYALLIKTEVEPGEDFTDPSSKEDIPRHHGKNMERVGLLEAQAFSDGYRFAIGFAGGSCRDNLCGLQDCRVVEGKQCRFPLKARPSMEGVGIDVAGLVNQAGWKMNPVRARPVPTGEFEDTAPITVGIIFVE